MTKSEKTKQYIIEKAAPIFNIKGYAGTSLADLTQITGLTKGSIYGNFLSKEEVALSVFNYGVIKTRNSVDQKLALPSKTIDKIYALLDFFLESVFSPPIMGGCVFLNTSVEADDANPVLKEKVAGELSVSINYIANLFEKAIANGELSYECTPKSMAYNIFCAVEGAIMMSRVQGTIQPMQEVITFWKNQITILELN